MAAVKLSVAGTIAVFSLLREMVGLICKGLTGSVGDTL
jgi:hypothetical protein